MKMLCAVFLSIVLMPLAHAHYYDKETGLDQNGYRDYDPGSGRYIQSDPIGLNGGSYSTYLYVNNNPLRYTDPTGLDWIYQQSTGNIYYQPPAAMGGGPPQLISPGGPGQYAGQNAGFNNPANQNVPGTPNGNGGPLPQGTYDIGPGHYSPTTGPNTMNLIAQPGTNTFDRDLFRLHGDNSARNQSASEGCIVAGPKTRKRINGSIDRILRVMQ